jgi:transcriptional regulator with XRE-family HTH domain
MSYQMRNDPRARKAGRFIHRVQKEIQNAFVASGLKQQEIAEKLGVNRSVVNKRLLGESNLTLRTIADLAWAMDADIEFKLVPRRSMPERNHFDASSSVARLTGIDGESVVRPRTGVTTHAVSYEFDDA